MRRSKRRLSTRLRRTRRRLRRKVRRRIGKVYTKARRLKNNLSKRKLAKKYKKIIKKTVVRAKKVVKKAKKVAKKTVAAAKKVTKKTISVAKKATKKTISTAKKVSQKVHNVKKTAVKKAIALAKKTTWKDAASLTLDLIPIIGNAKAAYEATTGKDPITGRKLADWERSLAAAAILAGPVAKVGARGVKLAGKGTNELVTSLKKVASRVKNIKIPSIHLGEEPATVGPAVGNEPTRLGDLFSKIKVKGKDRKNKKDSKADKGMGKPQKPQKHQAEKKSNPQIGSGPYSHLIDSKHVGSGKNFTAAQKKKIIDENMKQNGGVVKSDQTGQILTKPQKSKKGVTLDPNEWQIDHIIPRDKGGANSYSNAQVLSRV